MLIKGVKILGLLLMIAFWAGNCQGQMENESNNDIGVALSSESTNLSYIWSVTGIEEGGQVIMLLRQEERTFMAGQNSSRIAARPGMDWWLG